MKVLLVTLYFPPAGGGGVQRSLKLATHLPGYGIETHVLAPDDPKWVHRDDELVTPTQAWVHRAQYVGPSGKRPADELHGTEGFERFATQVRLFGRRLLVPDENVSWNLTAIPAATRIVKREEIDVVITTSPPNSIHLIGAAVKRMTGVRWVADLRDSIVAHPHRRTDRLAVRVQGEDRRRGSPGSSRTRRTRSSPLRTRSPTRRARSSPPAPVTTIPNGCDFDDFAGLEYRRGERFTITHAGSFFGRRDPRPFLQALADSKLDAVARFVGDFRPADREWAEALGLGDRLELIPYASHHRALELQRSSDALLLLIPEAGGRGRGRALRQGLRVPGRRAPDPRRRAAGRGRRRPDPRGREPASSLRPRTSARSARRSPALHERWQAGSLNGAPLPEDVRERLDRRSRVREYADLLLNLGTTA